MEYIGILIGLIPCIGFILGFRYGIRLGNETTKGDIKPLRTPIKIVREAKESKEAEKETDKQEKEIDFVLGYSKEQAYEEMKKANQEGM